MLRRLCVALTLGILIMAARARGAAADPINAKNSLEFPATCDGQTVQFAVNGNGHLTPGHVVAAWRSLPCRRLTSPSSSPHRRGAHIGDCQVQAQRGRDLVTCSFDVSMSVPKAPSTSSGRPPASSHPRRSHLQAAQSCKGRQT
jgi:hypothetical protein